MTVDQAMTWSDGYTGASIHADARALKALAAEVLRLRNALEQAQRELRAARNEQWSGVQGRVQLESKLARVEAIVETSDGVTKQGLIAALKETLRSEG